MNIADKCRVCGNIKGNRAFMARETSKGTGEEFEYFQCAKCDCLQIREFPADLGRFYADGYVSFDESASPQEAKLGLPIWISTMGIAGDIIDGLLDGGPESMAGAMFVPEAWRVLIGGLVDKAVQYYIPEWGAKRASARVLDVGSGSGTFMRDLRDAGFEDVLGVDLFLPSPEANYANGAKVIRGSIDDVAGQFDLVMFHHSFEHIASPLETLCTVSRLLADEGACLIRMPIVPSEAWEEYGTDWVQLDAPRHLFVHSRKSMRLLAEQAGLVVTKTLFDSTILQFVGSEQCKRGIPLFGNGSAAIDLFNSTFSIEEFRAFASRTKEVNKQGRGDQVAFYLSKG